MLIRDLLELTTEEAYYLARDRFGHSLPPLDSVENEDWGRDYVLQCLMRQSAEELATEGVRKPGEDQAVET